MMNFPIQDGTSGHLIGATLAVALLGLPFGVLAISVVLAIQCLIFSDGGLSVLGANILNMAIIGCLSGFLIHKFFFKKHDKKWAKFFFGICSFSGSVFAATPRDYERPLMITTIKVSPSQNF